MEHCIVECSFDEPFTGEDERETASAIDRYLQEHGGHWVRSYYNKDRTRLICEFEAPDAATVRKAWEEAACPYDSVWVATVYEHVTAESR